MTPSTVTATTSARAVAVSTSTRVGHGRMGMLCSAPCAKANRQLLTVAGVSCVTEDPMADELVPVDEMKGMFAGRTKQLFEWLDKDGSGQIDKDELKLMCESLGRTVSDDQAAAALKTLDKGNDGKLSYSEFMEWFKLGLTTDAITGAVSPNDLRLKIEAAKEQAREFDRKAEVCVAHSWH